MEGIKKTTTGASTKYSWKKFKNVENFDMKET